MAGASGDEDTQEVRAFEITGSQIGDVPVLPDPLDQIPAIQEIGSVTADGAYDTRKCHDAIADRGAHSIIPLPERSGDIEADTTAGAVPKPRCIV